MTADPRRRKRVAEGVRRWSEDNGLPPPAAPHADDALAELDALLQSPLGRAWITDADLEAPVERRPPEGPLKAELAPLPRRRLLEGPEELPNPDFPATRSVAFRVTLWLVVRRVLVWYGGLYRFLFGILWDLLRGKGSEESRAQRLRRVLESLGPTAVKVGQQLALRADVIPYVYCNELSKMLDTVPPFPIEQAIEAIERVTGKKVLDTFQIFDPKPIGSASIACVYQAMLHNGEKVAIKVRRPGIGPILTADLEAFGWLMQLGELLGTTRAGMTKTLQDQMRDMLLEEVDFRREARNTEVFRTRAIETGPGYILSPKVYHELSGDDVLVTELVEGVFITEILGALDRKDEEALASLAKLDIDPKVLAQRMLQIFNWQTLESIIFHGDPHPANIIVKPGNIVVFIDFGSCGRFSTNTRRIWHEIHYQIAGGDVAAVVATALRLLEPLPPVDLETFSKELEKIYWDWLYAISSDHAEWWEKATGVFWMRIVSISNRFYIPMALDTLRLFRTVFAFDAIIYRLWVKLDIEAEYRKFARRLGNKSAKRVNKQLGKRLENGLLPRDYLMIEELIQTYGQAVRKVHSMLEAPNHEFANVVGKAAFVTSALLKTLPFLILLHGFSALALVAIQRVSGRWISLSQALDELVRNPFYQFGMLIFTVVWIRRVVLKMQAPDVR